jgi:hypothetical protein
MYAHESDMFFDVYPFINSADDLPSARVSLHKPSGTVTFQGPPLDAATRTPCSGQTRNAAKCG